MCCDLESKPLYEKYLDACHNFFIQIQGYEALEKEILLPFFSFEVLEAHNKTKTNWIN